MKMCIRDSDDAILRDGKKDVQQFTLGGKALAAARGAEVKAVGGFQLFAVSHDDVMGQGVQDVYKRQGSGHSQSGLSGFAGPSAYRPACGI